MAGASAAASKTTGKLVTARAIGEFGAVSVVVPNALMAWGMTRQSARDAGTPMLTFAVWELVKIILAVAILVAVVVGYASLSWAALLSTLVVTLKANWLALLGRGRIRK